MIHIILYEPEIPPNTGNIMRLCANTGCKLHLIQPLGFELDDKRMRRAGLDYLDWNTVAQYSSLQLCLSQLDYARLYALSTKGSRAHTEAKFAPGDALLFGPETRGLPATVLDSLQSDQILRIPMLAESRSMNLSNSVAVCLYEAWRQLDFQGST
jgi:tRNA (cytidine/uridine-2'-O-)-methyltransferase